MQKALKEALTKRTPHGVLRAALDFMDNVIPADAKMKAANPIGEETTNVNFCGNDVNLNNLKPAQARNMKFLAHVAAGQVREGIELFGKGIRMRNRSLPSTMTRVEFSEFANKVADQIETKW